MRDHHVRHVFAIWQLATLYLKQKLLWKATRLTCARGMDTIALLHVKIMQANYSSANFVTLPLIPLIMDKRPIPTLCPLFEGFTVF